MAQGPQLASGSMMGPLSEANNLLNLQRVPDNVTPLSVKSDIFSAHGPHEGTGPARGCPPSRGA